MNQKMENVIYEMESMVSVDYYGFNFLNAFFRLTSIVIVYLDKACFLSSFSAHHLPVAVKYLHSMQINNAMRPT